MRKLKLKNAKIELLTENKVSFIGELAGYKQRFKMTITNIQRYYDLKKLDENVKYNIWKRDDEFVFIPQND